MPIDPNDPIYNALKALWPTLSAGTTQQKCDQVNAKTVPLPQPAIVTASQILNACAAVDLEGLTATQIALLQLLLAGQRVDSSAGTAIRAVCQNIFAGKASLTSLAALVSPFDNYTQLWYLTPVVQGGGGLGAGNPVTVSLCSQLGLI